MIIDFLSNPNSRSYDLSSLRVLSGGGAAMPEAVAQQLGTFGLTFVEGYGLTETMAPTHINPPERPKQQCLGIPIFDVDSRVVDPETLRELPAGEVGEIIMHGPQVFRGYWKQPEATAEAFVELDGKRFFRTGDLGHMDEEGYFFITDRLKRMINACGFKVWPAEVEAMLYEHPGDAGGLHHRRARRLPRRDGEGGDRAEEGRAGEGERRGDHRSGRAANMAAYKVPRMVEFVDALPKSATGKVMWRKLQEEENRKAT